MIDRKALKQLQEMQEKMLQTQAEITASTFEGKAGGGVVTARMTGSQEFESVTIDPSAVDPADVDMLQDLIVAAVNDALKQFQSTSQQKMGALTGGLQIPGLG
jgi:DNA-binding YbaB/EbfC family protein